MDKEEALGRLLEGFQRHVSTASRTWTALAILSLYAGAAALLPSGPDTTGNATRINLPAVEGVSLERQWFILATTGIMAALITRWVEALSRAVYTRRELVEPLLEGGYKFDGVEVKSKDLWDAQVALGTSTVWSAPAALLRFRKKPIQVVAFPYLVILKVLSVGVHYGIPGFVILALACTFDDPGASTAVTPAIVKWLVWALVGAGCIQLGFGLIAECRYSVEALRHMWVLSRKPSA